MAQRCLGAGVVELMSARNTLSTKAEADGDSVDEPELCEVLTHLGITCPPPAAVALSPGRS